MGFKFYIFFMRSPKWYGAHSHSVSFKINLSESIYIQTVSYGFLVTHQNTLQLLTLKVLFTTIDAQWEGMRDEGSARYEPTLLPPCQTIRILSYSN